MNPLLHIENPKTAKEAIIQLLSKEFPLATKSIHFKLQREYGLGITYQAVHKALLELEKEHALVKEKNQWKLNQNWLQHHEQFIQQALQKYSGNKNRYTIDLNFHGTQVFEFDNFTDFSVESAKLVADKILSPSGEPAYFVLEYGWWTLKFKFEHLELLFKLMMSAPKSKNIIQRVSPFGKWLRNQYVRAGGISAPIGTNTGIQQDMLIQGEWIVEVNFSDESKKTIEHYWNKWKNLEDCFKEFGLKNEPKMEINVKVTQNPQLAEFMRKQFDEYMSEAC